MVKIWIGTIIKMAISNIAAITNSLITLIEAATDTTVVAEPPIRNNIDGIGIYLYHVVEDAHYKNQTAPGRDNPPVRFTPMALRLYYHLSCSCPTADNTSAALVEQERMSQAMKVLHDYPEITETSQINGDFILPMAIRDRVNRFRIEMQTITPSDAIHFWTAGGDPIKLSAYYEVSVVFLTPEEPQQRAGRVLSYGVNVFTAGTPKLLSSRNQLTFTMPDSSTAQVNLSPAQVPYGSQVTFTGTGLSGNSPTLILSGGQLSAPVRTDAWSVSATGSEVQAIVQTTAISTENNSVVNIIPGVYAAKFQISRQIRLPNGDFRMVRYDSNRCPFTVTPSIDLPIASAVAGIYTITGSFYPTNTSSSPEVEVYTGIYSLRRHVFHEDTDPDLSVGEFEIVDGLNPTDSVQIRLIVHEDLTVGTLVPLRIFINGAESPPVWIIVPTP